MINGLRDLWDNNERANIHVIRVAEGKEGEGREREKRERVRERGI